MNVAISLSRQSAVTREDQAQPLQTVLFSTLNFQ